MPPPSGRSTLGWLRYWADLLDTRFRIPGTGVRFGIDPILSLIPGLGDLASPIFTAALLAQGLGQGIPKIVMLRMVANALIDAAIGAVPGLGTVGDIFWRANIANLRLLERHAVPGHRPSTGDYAFAWGLVALFGLMMLVPIALAFWVSVEIWRWLHA